MTADSLRPVARAAQRFYETKGRRIDSTVPPAERPDARRAWLDVHAVLEAYTAPSNADSAGRPIEPFPLEVADFLQNVVAELLTGRVPETVMAATRPGAPSYGPAMMQAINWSVLYANAAAAGLIADKSPKQTVLSTIGIADRTWKEWRKRADPAETDPAKFWNDTDLPDVRRAEMICERLRWAAELYQRVGRPDAAPRGGAAN
jgi:hypothetical protein